MPVFPCGSDKRKALATVIFEDEEKSGVANFIPFFRMPFTGAETEGAEDMVGPRDGGGTRRRSNTLVEQKGVERREGKERRPQRMIDRIFLALRYPFFGAFEF